eukprot:6471352-Amphidinium_carterae.1
MGAAGFQQAGSAGIDEKAEGYLKSFFKRITVSWPTHGSQMALYAQAEIIFRRLLQDAFTPPAILAHFV